MSGVNNLYLTANQGKIYLSKDESPIKVKLVRLGPNVKFYLSSELTDSDTTIANLDADIMSQDLITITQTTPLYAPLSQYYVRYCAAAGIDPIPSPTKAPSSPTQTHTLTSMHSTRTDAHFDTLSLTHTAMTRVCVYLDTRSMAMFMAVNRRVMNTYARSNVFWYCLYRSRFRNTGFKENELVWRKVYMNKSLMDELEAKKQGNNDNGQSKLLIKSYKPGGGYNNTDLRYRFDPVNDIYF